MVDPMTSKEIAGRWDKDGFLVVRNAIPSAVLEPVRAFIGACVDEQARRELAAGRLGSLYRDLPFGRRYAAMHEELPAAAERLFGTPRGRHGPEFHRLYNHPGITDVLRVLLGPEVTLHTITKIRVKLPDEVSIVPWHQDSHYYNGILPPGLRGGTEHMHIVTVWVPLVEATLDNGCLWVLPGSHRWGFLERDWDENNRVRLAAEVEQRGTPTPLPMRPGDVAFFTNMTVHASKENRSDRVRWSLDFRYHAAAGTLQPATPERRATDEWNVKCHRFGTEPLTILSGAGPTPTWEQWDRASGEREAEFQARDG
jgi:hypothetical protein